MTSSPADPQPTHPAGRAGAPSEPPPATPKRRSVARRVVTVLAILFAVLILLVLAAPWILSMGWVSARAEREATAALGVPVRIGDVEFGWFRGFELSGVAVDNPEGFPQDRKLFVLERAAGDLDLLDLLAGRVDFAGTVDGMALRIYQKPDGTTNLDVLRRRAAQPSEPDEPPGERKPVDLSPVRLDVKLQNGLVEVHREPDGLLERIENLTATVQKDWGTSQVDLSLTADLARPAGAAQAEGAGPGAGAAAPAAGKLALQVDLDATFRQPVALQLRTEGLDLARYAPIARSFLPEGHLTAMAGVVRSTLDATADLSQPGRTRIATSGELVVAQPHFAGAALRGMDLRAERWVLRPNLEVSLQEGPEPPLVDLAALHVDLGFLRADGAPAEVVSQLLGGKPGVGLSLVVDLDALGKLGGPVPQQFAESGGRVQGALAYALTTESLRPEVLKERLPELLVADAKVTLARYRAVGGIALQDVDGRLQVRDGGASLDANAVVNGGPATVKATADLRQMETLPAALQLGWKEGKVAGDAVRWVRYVFPLLAGIDPAAQAGLDFESGISTELRLEGPLLAGAEQSWLQWLNQWRGAGELELRDGRFSPAPQIAGLLQMIGQRGTLSFQETDTSFTLRQGLIDTGLTKLAAVGERVLTLRGATGLDGRLDYTLELQGLLKGDLEKVAAVIGDQGLAAKLTGTVERPQLELPDLDTLLQEAVKRGAGKAVEDALQKGLEKGLEKGLGDLFKKKPKDGDKK